MTRPNNRTSTVPPFVLGGRPNFVGNVAFFEWDRKLAKTLLEVAFDLTGWPKWVQDANYAKKCTIFSNTITAHRGDFRAQ